MGGSGSGLFLSKQAGICEVHLTDETHGEVTWGRDALQSAVY